MCVRYWCVCVCMLALVKIAFERSLLCGLELRICMSKVEKVGSIVLLHSTLLSGLTLSLPSPLCLNHFLPLPSPLLPQPFSFSLLLSLLNHFLLYLLLYALTIFLSPLLPQPLSSSLLLSLLYHFLLPLLLHALTIFSFSSPSTTIIFFSFTLLT